MHVWPNAISKHYINICKIIIIIIIIINNTN